MDDALDWTIIFYGYGDLWYRMHSINEMEYERYNTE